MKAYLSMKGCTNYMFSSAKKEGTLWSKFLEDLEKLRAYYRDRKEEEFYM